MILSAEVIVSSLFLGLILSLIYLFMSFIRKKFKPKKYIVFIIDILFALLCCVLSFLLSLAISAGFPRLMQYLLEGLAFCCVMYVFSGNKKRKKKV
ncbi:MAG: spore cortex biosynthesis protein YabQ [Clostridia bacterium]